MGPPLAFWTTCVYSWIARSATIVASSDVLGIMNIGAPAYVYSPHTQLSLPLR